jgi:hypothetical protein
MKKIKFITTFNYNGYNVYGKPWIESFLEFTKDYDHISAKVYVNNMDLNLLDYGPKVEVVDFDVVIPEHQEWLELFGKQSKHDQWNRDLAIKFSFKSFVMMDALKNNDNCYIIWLDGDSIFKSYEFDNFPTEILQDTFIACQREDGSEHVESGIIIFDAEHQDKKSYVDCVENLYMNPNMFNNFGQFFDGFVTGRTLNRIQIKYIDLNKKYGIGGIQSDPSCTFLNPELKKRFHHNIGITGKKSYQNWKDFAHKDPFFQLIHGINDKSPEEQLQENLEHAKLATRGFVR